MARFRPRALPTIGLALGAVLFGSLGTWQLRRREEAAEELRAWEARLAEPPFEASAPPADPDVRRARVAGVPQWTRHVLLVNQVWQQELGYRLVVPVLVGSGNVLVDLGWIPMDGVEAALAAERARGELRSFEGLARVYPETADAARDLPPETDGFQRTWRAWSPRAMAGETPVASFVLHEGQPLPERGVGSDREPPVGGWAARPHQRPHGEYALTWFGILGALIVFWLSASMERQGERG